MSYEVCKAIIKEFSLENKREIVGDFISNTKFPYKQRLEIFLATPEELRYGEDYCLFDHPTISEDDWEEIYTTGNVERHQRIDLITVPAALKWDAEKTRKWFEGLMSEKTWYCTFDW